MLTNDNPSSFQEVLEAYLNKMGMKPEQRDLFLKVQELSLVKDEYTSDLGMGGWMLFMEKYSRWSYYLHNLHTVQSENEIGRGELERRGILDKGVVVVIPSIDVDGNVNSTFFLPDSPKEIQVAAKKLEKTILRKRGVEHLGSHVER